MLQTFISLLHKRQEIPVVPVGSECGPGTCSGGAGPVAGVQTGSGDPHGAGAVSKAAKVLLP